MQNRYVGDVGDFGKYGLLRALCLPSKDDNSELSLGVVWYLVPPEEDNNDGKYTQYLKETPKNKSLFRACDEKLYDALSKIINAGERRIKNIRESDILPTKTVYYEETLSFDDMPSIGPMARERRLAHRRGWVQDALYKTAGCDVVFIDPDNGLEIDNVKRHTKKGPKYAFYDELSKFIENDKSLVIYQHTSRRGAADAQIKRRVSQLKERLNVSTDILALRFRRGTSRAFFIIPSKRHEHIITERVNSFLASPWKEHFTPVSTS